MVSLLLMSVKFATRANVHISKCLPKVKKFIEDDHQNDNIVFWFDLAKKSKNRVLLILLFLLMLLIFLRLKFFGQSSVIKCIRQDEKPQKGTS
jgi:hypothetical protein